MKKLKSLMIVVALAIVTFMSSCSITVPVAATSNPVGNKVGIAKSMQVFGFFPDGGDMSIKTAAKNGGITKISTVDFRHSLVFFGIIQSYETIITGE